MSSISKAVDKAINSGTDQIDWTRTFDIIDRLNSRADYRPPALDAAYHFISRGARRERLNAINFIDALFKNGSNSLLQFLQSSKQVLALGDEKVQNDPFCHRVVTKLIPEWVKACNEHDVITPQFQQWANHTKSYQFQYELTQEVATKFKSDFQDCLDMLQMFSQLLLAAKSYEEPLIQEIFPNVLEIHSRLKELTISMPDESAIAIISYLIRFCEECTAGYRSLSSTGFVDPAPLNEIASRGIPSSAAQNPNQISINQPEAPPPMPVPAPVPVPAPLPPPPNTRPFNRPEIAHVVVDDLIDFGAPMPNPYQDTPANGQIPNPYGMSSQPPPQPQNPGYPSPPPGYGAPPPQQTQYGMPPPAPQPQYGMPPPAPQPQYGMPPQQMGYGIPPPQQQYPQPPPGYGVPPQYPQVGNFGAPTPGQTQQQQPPMGAGGKNDHFEFDDDDGNVTNEEFAGFLNNIKK